MAIEVIMPQLGESVVEGTVTKWLKQVNDPVEEFEPLVEVNTDKVDTEVPAPSSGTVLALYVQEGETVKAGTLLAMIGEPGEQLPEPAAVERAAVEPVARAQLPVAETARVPASAREPSPTLRASATSGLGFISPVVARIASEHQIDLAQITGTGRGGRITKMDVLAYLESAPAAPASAPWEEPASGELFRPSEEVFGAKAPTPAPSPAEEAAWQPGTVQPLDAIRQSIAEHMIRSKHTSAHVTTVMEADMARVIAHRSANKQDFLRDGANLTFTAYFVAAAVAGLKAVPVVNSSWSESGIQLHQAVNIGVAVSLGQRGLIVPVIKNADELSLLAIARSVNDLAERARNRQLTPNDVQGGTFTITNHGTSHSLFATPIINQPQAAILGVGTIQKRAVVVEARSPTGETADSIAIRPMAYLTLTFDHRILDGAIADQFLGIVVDQLQRWS